LKPDRVTNGTEGGEELRGGLERLYVKYLNRKIRLGRKIYV
jgi:hypothetical protein